MRKCSSMHQHTPLREIMQIIRSGRTDVVRGCLDYHAYVCKQTYDYIDGWETERRSEREAQWPEYHNSVLMLSRPTYQRNGPSFHVCSPGVRRSVLVADGETYAAAFRKDVQLLQEHKQHHIHIPDQDGVRQPLAHCRRADDPSKCKGGFPREKELIDVSVVICQGLARAMAMSVSGRRNMLGSLHGPVNEPNLNSSHPGLLTGLRCNVDAQLPYRLPIC